MEEVLVTVEAAAKAAAISRSVAYALIASGQWPSVKIGRARRVPIDALRAWISAQTEQSEARA